MPRAFSYADKAVPSALQAAAPIAPIICRLVRVKRFPQQLAVIAVPALNDDAVTSFAQQIYRAFVTGNIGLAGHIAFITNARVVGFQSMLLKRWLSATDANSSTFSPLRCMASPITAPEFAK